MNLTKDQLRHNLKIQRQNYHATIDQNLIDLRLWKYFTSLNIPKKSIISGYLAYDNEFNITPFLTQLILDGYTVCVPITHKQNFSLLFRQWTPHAQTTYDDFGIEIPISTAKECIPDVLLIPMIGFDNNNTRLGKGKGHYDRTIESLKKQKKIITIGIAYEIQKVEKIPIEIHDHPMDYIITDQHLYTRNDYTR